MNFLIKLAIRNTMTHGNRSVVTLLLGVVSTALLVFSSAWMEGSHQQMIRNAVEIYPGYIQITAAQFRKNPGSDHLIFDVEKLQKQVEAVKGVKAFSPRFESFVLYSVGEKTVGGMLTGIYPKKENSLSRLHSSLIQGNYLSVTDTNRLYIGMELARRLHVGVGEEVVFVGSGADYSFAADKLVVGGIFQTGLFDFDASSAFLAKPYFDTIMAAENLATHGIVLPEDSQQADELARQLSLTVGEQYQSASWKETMSALLKAMKLDSVFGYITLGILFTVIFFVVMIYTLLSVFARIREIGIMRALGTTPKQVFSCLFLESSILGFISVLGGGLIGASFAYYYSVNPIVFSGMEEQFKQYGLAASAIPTTFEPLTILRDMVVMFVLLLLSTLYPIFKVNRYQPVEAIHHV